MYQHDVASAWRTRYGLEAPSSVPEGLSGFLNHRSVRKYSEREVPEGLIEGLMAAAQSASTSSNLHLWTAISVQDPERRAAIAKLCADQKQVHNAPWFFAFIADLSRVEAIAAHHGDSTEGLESAEMYTMAVVDATLAAERFVCAAESIGLGICYIGALRDDPQGVADLLGLPERAFGIFGLCVGYPAEGIQADVKPRLAPRDQWLRERYEPLDPADYNARMARFYAEQKMSGDVTWSSRSAKRIGLGSLGTRLGQLEWLKARGFLRR